ncbi:terminase small subunit [Roseivivax sp. THAF197b]|uniref:terminase small subunit n=1 Tax=Roseivivax sp. THAF197b TaxID=2588299 RepID=UPI00126961E6|nr:terminase small subunit [Roseivivax sp. THAF197b]QFS84814.1 Terminase small subunit [Roseivivax sp. THAF197b]
MSNNCKPRSKSQRPVADQSYSEQQHAETNANAPFDGHEGDWTDEFDLTEQQAEFVQYYSDHGVGIRAARQAGIRKQIAKRVSQALLKKPNIRDAIRYLEKVRRSRGELNKKFVLERLKSELNADIGDLYDADNRLKSIGEWPEAFRLGMVEAIDVKTTETKNGTVTQSLSVKFASRIKRMEMLMRSLEMFRPTGKEDVQAELLAAAREITRTAPGARPGQISVPDDD